MNKELANARTRSEVGLDYVISSININTPFGKKRIKEKTPFFPGEEEQLRQEYKGLYKILEFVKLNPKSSDALLHIFMEIKDISFTILRSSKEVLSVVELFEIKSLLLKIDKISKILQPKAKQDIPEKYLPINLDLLLEKLDIRNDKMETFYIYDEFSEALREARTRKREPEASIRKEHKNQKDNIKQKYGIELTPKFEYTVSKAGAEQLRMIREIPELVQSDEDHVSVTFSIKNTEATDRLFKEIEEATAVIEEQELLVREELSKEIGSYADKLLINCEKIGELDIAVSKALYAIKTNCIIPEIVQEHIIDITAGRHLQVEDMLMQKSKSYQPISVKLFAGVTCITGANMGGKTVSLKLVGLISLLTQNAFFVPCEKAVMGLSNYMQILIGDNQSIERGLSSFGSEMKVLKEILEKKKDRSIFLIDEIASGTNPKEGFALTKSLVEYLKKRPYISLITTHFDSIAAGGGINNIQVVGLSGVDFEKLDEKIRKADKNERINIIAKLMDYRLYKVTEDRKVPRDAIHIANILGIDEEIIANAKKYLEDY